MWGDTTLPYTVGKRINRKPFGTAIYLRFQKLNVYIFFNPEVPLFN